TRMLGVRTLRCCVMGVAARSCTRRNWRTGKKIDVADRKREPKEHHLDLQSSSFICLKVRKLKVQQTHKGLAECIAQGGTLTIPRDKHENKELWDYAKRTSPGTKDFWIGVTDIVREGHYVDVNSAPVSYFNWDRSRKEPTGGKRESCVTLSLASQGKWHDEVCWSLKKYICEYLIP
uniref:C-type lectin domain family 3 member A n=1 Tax=Paramormyrops kingsleyae TaxID=1676925 RepID=A0A3B3SDP6_9TELE